MFSSSQNSAGFSSLQQKHIEYIREATSLAKNTFNQSRRVKSLFRYSGEVLFSENRNPITPVVILLAGASQQTNFFVTNFALLLRAHLMEPILDWTVSESDSPSRLVLEQRLFTFLDEAERNRIVILRGIEKLDGAAPLVLHSLSDPDTSPFKKLFVLLTVDLDYPLDKTESSHLGCDEHVLNYLLNKWNNEELTNDKIYPIYSRISSLLQCI